MLKSPGHDPKIGKGPEYGLGVLDWGQDEAKSLDS